MKRAQVRRYHFRGWWKWLWLSMGGVIGMSALFIAGILWQLTNSLALNPNERYIVLALSSLIVILTLGLAGLVVLLYFKTYLEVDDHGISFQQPALRLHSSWQDVKAISDVPFGRLQVKGLQLENAQLTGSPPLKWLTQRTGQDKVMALSPFMKDWQQKLRPHLAPQKLLESSPQD